MPEEHNYFEDGQMALLPSNELDDKLFSEDERKGKYTAARLKAQRPKIYNLVVSLVAEGVSFKAITRATGCHRLTIKAVMLSDPRLIDSEKSMSASRFKLARTILSEKILEALDELDIKSTTDLQRCAIVLGVLTDKAELLSGGPTQRIVRTEERLEDLVEHFNNLPGGPVFDAEFVPTGFDGPNHETKEVEALAEPDGASVDSHSVDSGKPASDYQ